MSGYWMDRWVHGWMNGWMGEWRMKGNVWILVEEWQEKQGQGRQADVWGVDKDTGDLLGGNGGEREVVRRPSA